MPVAGGKMATSVLFSCAALPEDAQELLTLLHHEQPPLRLWIEFASAYWAAGKREHCMRVLEDGVHPGAPPFPTRAPPLVHARFPPPDTRVHAKTPRVQPPRSLQTWRTCTQRTPTVG